MALRRKGKQYSSYLRDNAQTSKIPYTTWRRWLLQGKITEERLLQLGINPGRRPQWKNQRRYRTGNSDDSVNGVQENTAVLSASDANVVDRNLPSTSTYQPMYTVNHPQSGSNSSVSGSESSKNVRPQYVDSEENQSESETCGDNQEYFDTSSEREIFSGVHEFLGESDDDLNVQNDGECGGESSRISSVLESKKIGVEALNQPLSPTSNVTKFETLLMILHLALRHSLTDVFVEDLMSFVNEIVGLRDAIPGSKYWFHKLFMFGSEPNVHFFCPSCKIYLGPKTLFKDGKVCCNECDWLQSVSSLNANNYFITISIQEQLKTLLSRPNLKLVKREQHVGSIVSDIYHGQIYQNLMKNNGPLSNENALTITISTDGAPVYENGKNTLYPIHFYLNEIPPEERFDTENILLAGLWFSKIGEPDLQIFLKPLVNELQALSKFGIVWKKPDGSVVDSPVHLTCCCTDSVCRPKVLNTMQFNGSYGCSYCLHPNLSFVWEVAVKPRSGITTAVESAISSDSDSSAERESMQLVRRKKIMRYLAGKFYPLRTDRETREHMKIVAQSILDHIYGVKGECVLLPIDTINLVFGIPIDYMHNILLGVMKHLAELWFDSTSSGHKYYIGPKIDMVNDRLSEIIPPSFMAKPRPMSERAHWKAKEWRGFLLYYGLPCLLGILPDNYYNHFKKLVTAIYILTKESMECDEVEEANSLLQSFVIEYQTLYGEVNMVFNVHLVTHLARQVAKLGPLWAYSLFPFETANGRVIKLVKGTKGVASTNST